MKRSRMCLLFGVFMLLLCCRSASAQMVYLDDAYGDGSIFGKVNYVYYRVEYDSNFCLTVNAVYGFADAAKELAFERSCSGYQADDGKKTWNKRYAFILCDKNRKEIDPVGWHKPGKKNYRYQYNLKSGTYYLKIKTRKKKCGIFFINGSYGLEILNNPHGGSKKSKAKKLKTPDGSSYDTEAALTNSGWNGNIYDFSYMDSGKNAQAWFKFYSDGSTPTYVVARVDNLVGKWEMTVYGPSYKKGITKTFPGSIVVNKKGIVELYKNGKRVDRINKILLARRNNVTGEMIGPKAGWYYVKVSKHKTPGKKAEYYKRMSLLGDVYVTTNSAFASLRYSQG